MYIGKTPTSVPLTSSDITDGIISTAKIANDAATLAKMAQGTDGNLISYDASGNPVAVATGNDGQVLTSTGAGSPPAFEALPSGGLSMADQWRLTSNFTCGTSDTTFTSNLEQIDTSGQNTVGTAMSESSGVFTFPSTGIYMVTANVTFTSSVSKRAVYVSIVSGTTYLAQSYDGILVVGGDDTFANVTATTYFNVGNTSNDTIIFRGTNIGSGNVLALGDTSKNLATFTFIKLN